MNYLLHIYRIAFLFLSTAFLSIEVSSTQQGSSYFFYQQPEYPRDCKEARETCSSDITSGVYTIKPDGYPQPFEVYCDNDDSSSGWTVIERQFDGSLTFRRRWLDYKNGFGFLSSEFWIGNDKLSYLTNQAVYELRIDITLSNGSSFYINYKSFRISDEWSDYNIVSAKEFRSNWNCIVSQCPLNMTQDSCTCQNLCTDPIGQTDCYTECEETCVPEGCFVADTNSYIANGESFINGDCTQNCTCIDNQLSCNRGYRCSTDATCSVKNEIRRCYCKEGFKGDGQSCTSNYFKDCYEAYQADNTATDGIYTIMPTGWPGSPFNVFCNMTFGDGGWTVFQRRIDGTTDFYRNWVAYQQGFGVMTEGNDFWLGNEQLHYLTDQKNYILRIDFVDSSDRPFYEEYRTFKIGDTDTKYRLSYSSYIGGTTGYNYLDYNNGMRFSTRDQDNDGCGNHHYAQRHRSGWWYSDHSRLCSLCSSSVCYDFEYGSNGCYTGATASNLNGAYNGGNGQNIFHYNGNGGDCNHKYAEMKIRPVTT